MCALQAGMSMAVKKMDVAGVSGAVEWTVGVVRSMAMRIKPEIRRMLGMIGKMTLRSVRLAVVMLVVATMIYYYPSSTGTRPVPGT